jgi:hypothetical protein
MSKHAKDGAHASGQVAKDTGYVGRHREPPPVIEVRSPAEQAAYIAGGGSGDAANPGAGQDLQ